MKRYYSNTKDQEDLISIGTIGLIKAASTFDYDKGTRFATYASRCIENEVLMHFRNLRKSSQDVFISDPIDTDKEGNSLTLQDIMSDDDNIFDRIDLRLKSEKMYNYIDSHLSGREKKILIMRYGLYCTKPLTQREVADALGISRSYVSHRAYCKRTLKTRITISYYKTISGHSLFNGYKRTSLYIFVTTRDTGICIKIGMKSYVKSDILL